MTITSKITIVLLLACALTITVEEHRVRTARAGELAAALATSNAIAERDSTRNVALENARVARLVGDSIRIVEKRVVQVEAGKDALDRALGGERKARLELVAGVDSLRRSGAALVREDAGVRHARFVVRQMPYTIDADVAIPAPPDSGRIALSVALDPMPLSVRIRCEKPDAHDVRAATLVVSAPRWANVTLGQLEQSTDVCMPAVPVARGKSRLALAPVVGVGFISRDRGRASLGYFAGLGVGWRR